MRSRGIEDGVMYCFSRTATGKSRSGGWCEKTRRPERVDTRIDEHVRSGRIEPAELGTDQTLHERPASDSNRSGRTAAFHCRPDTGCGTALYTPVGLVHFCRLPVRGG